MKDTAKSILIGTLLILMTTSSAWAREVTIPDLQEAVNSAEIGKDEFNQLSIKVPNRPEFEQPLHSLVNRGLLVPTSRGLVFRPEVSEQEIVNALVRHGMSVATETQKNREDMEALKATDRLHDSQIASLGGRIDTATNASRSAFALAFGALGVSLAIFFSRGEPTTFVSRKKASPPNIKIVRNTPPKIKIVGGDTEPDLSKEPHQLIAEAMKVKT